MDSMNMEQQSKTCHVVSMPYPGGGHLNAMMNLCKLLCSANPDILITFVVTEEWYSFICGDSAVTKPPPNIEFATIPNIIPSELVRGNDLPGFIRAVSTKMEGPFEELLDGAKLPVNAIVADACLGWMVGVGNRKNIPIASFWPMPTTVFSFFYHFENLNGSTRTFTFKNLNGGKREWLFISCFNCCCNVIGRNIVTSCSKCRNIP